MKLKRIYAALFRNFVDEQRVHTANTAATGSLRALTPRANVAARRIASLT